MRPSVALLMRPEGWFDIGGRTAAQDTSRDEEERNQQPDDPHDRERRAFHGLFDILFSSLSRSARSLRHEALPKRRQNDVY